MLIFLLLAHASAAAPLAAVGDVLGDAPVREVVVHAEFQRITVELPGGIALPLEVTAARPDTTTGCVHHGLAVYPRFELTPLGETQPVGDAAVAALCARLEAAGAPDIRLQAPAEPEDEAEPEGPKIRLPEATGWRPLHAVLLALIGACLAAVVPVARAGLSAEGRADLAGVAATGLLARLALSPRGLQIFPDAGFETLVLMWGSLRESHPLYGDGLRALHAPLQAATAWDPEAAFGLHLGLSALAPPLLWALAWLTCKDRVGALTAGLGLAVLPVALRLAGSEVPHVPLLTFELLAVVAAVGFLELRMPALAVVAGLSAGFFPHLRPESLPMVAIPLGILAIGGWRHRDRAVIWGPAALSGAVAIGLVAWRVSALPPLGDVGAVRWGSLVSPGFWIEAFWPQIGPLDDRPGEFQVFLDLRVTPIVLPVLALVGLARGRREVALGCLLWWALTVVPVLPKSWPLMDAWRLQLPGQVPLLLLAGLGASALPRWKWAAPVGVVLTALPLMGMVRETWAGQAEWAALPEALAKLPAGATVLYPDHEVHAEKGAQVAALVAHRAGVQARWLPMTPFADDPRPGPDLFAWEDLTCRIATLPSRHVENGPDINACLRLRARCQLVPFAVTTLPPRGDLDLGLSAPIEVGLYRVDGCR